MAVLLGVVVVVAVVIAVVVSQGSGSGHGGAGRPATSGKAVNDISAGFTGASGWRLAPSVGFEITADGGRSWTPDALPDKVPDGDVVTASTGVGQPTLVAVSASTGLSVLRQARLGAPWVTTPIDAPSDLRRSDSRSVLLTQAPSGFVALVDGIILASAEERLALFTSTNGGRSFREVSSTTGPFWESIAFRSASDGVVLEGASANSLRYTVDGGAAWADASTPTEPNGASFGSPFLVGKHFVVPAISASMTESEHVYLLASSDGRTFSPDGATLRIPAADSPSAVISAAAGREIWIFANQLLFTSSNAGASWVRSPSTTVPSGVLSAALDPDRGASVVATDTACTGTTPGCASAVETFGTANDGLHWSAQH